MEMGTKQASFPGVGAGLGPPPGRVGLGANIGAWGGGGHSGRGGPGPGRQTPGLPSLPCSERAHQPLPVAPSVCTLDFSLSVHLVPNAVWGWCRWGGCLGKPPPPPWNGPVCAAMVLCCGCPFREDTAPCSIPALTVFITIIIKGFAEADGGRAAGGLQESPSQGLWPLVATLLTNKI